MHQGHAIVISGTSFIRLCVGLLYKRPVAARSHQKRVAIRTVHTLYVHLDSCLLAQ